MAGPPMLPGVAELGRGPLPPLPGPKTDGSSYSGPSSPSGSSSARVSKQESFQRTYKACLNCRARKVKCDFGDLANPSKPPCKRCKREGRDCQLVESRRGGIKNVLMGRERKARQAVAGGLGSSSGGGGGGPADANVSVSRAGSSSVDGDEFSQRELHNTSDALEILAQAARTFPRISTTSAGAGGPGGSTGTGVGNARQESDEPATQPEGDLVKAPRPATPVAECELVAERKLLTEDEVRMIVDFFFAGMHPFYPFIPPELHAAEQLTDVPFLLAAITSLASRYYVREVADPAAKRYWQQKHLDLWEYCQQLISKTVWGEASTRSLGTVFAFLLFSEWNPRAIHSKHKDYANDPWFTSREDAVKETVGLGAARRSDRMSWILIGNGIRLAQDLGAMETHPQVYIATHLSEVVLALRMGRRSMLGQMLDEPIPDMQFSQVEHAKLDILKIMSLAHETLYSSRKTTRELLRNGKYLSFLGLFGPHLEKWERTYAPLLQNLDGTLEMHSLTFDFHYTRLYIYSLALVSSSEYISMSAVATIIPSTRFATMAVDAAKELLGVASAVYQMGFLPRMPIRWVVRIVHAAVFLAKSLFLSTSMVSRDSQRRTIDIIATNANILLDSSIDEVHLCNRYGTILKNMCAQLSSKVDAVSAQRPSSSKRRKRTSEGAHSYHISSQQATSSGHPSTPGQQPAQPGQQPGLGSSVQAADAVTTSASPTAASDSSSYAQHDTTGHTPGTAPQSYPQAVPQPDWLPRTNDGSESLDMLSMLDIDFDFLTEGTEGLGFVEPLIEGIEQQQFIASQREKTGP